MYLIINKTKNKTVTHEGSYPLMYIEELLDNEQDIIIISLYSNTVKIPCGFDTINGIKRYEWKEYNIHAELKI